MMTVAHLKRIFRILSHNVSQNGVEERGVATDQHGHSSKSGPTRLSYQLITALSAIVMKIEKVAANLLFMTTMQWPELRVQPLQQWGMG